MTIDEIVKATVRPSFNYVNQLPCLSELAIKKLPLKTIAYKCDRSTHLTYGAIQIGYTYGRFGWKANVYYVADDVLLIVGVCPFGKVWLRDEQVYPLEDKLDSMIHDDTDLVWFDFQARRILSELLREVLK